MLSFPSKYNSMLFLDFSIVSMMLRVYFVGIYFLVFNLDSYRLLIWCSTCMKGIIVIYLNESAFIVCRSANILSTFFCFDVMFRISINFINKSHRFINMHKLFIVFLFSETTSLIFWCVLLEGLWGWTTVKINFLQYQI